MKADMHYHAVYLLARMGGNDQQTARRIATCSEFVDDNVSATDIEFIDGAILTPVPTAHHIGVGGLEKIKSAIANLDEKDQRRVWVPFHFLPGGEGEDYTQRLVCTKDGPLAREMVAHYLDLKKAGYDCATELLGIAAHVYGDTFSHYGFSGVASRRNNVVNDSFKFMDLDAEMESYIQRKAKEFFGRAGEITGRMIGNIKASVASWLTEEVMDAIGPGSLGHGAVATYPDRPYLKWSFEYEYPDDRRGIRVEHDNPATYLEGCRALHKMFTDFAGGGGRAFDDFQSEIIRVLAVQKSKEGRCAAWNSLCRELLDEDIPAYQGHDWNREWEKMNGSQSSNTVLDLPIWRFYRAAEYHRAYVLRDLMPRHGMVIC